MKQRPAARQLPAHLACISYKAARGEEAASHSDGRVRRKTRAWDSRLALHRINLCELMMIVR
jgi:hypothetical protein